MNLLTVAHGNEINYRGQFRTPLFQIWGAAGRLLEALHTSLSPLGVTLGNITVDETAKSPAERAIVIQAGNCVYTWRVEKVELVLRNFSNDDLRALPRLMDANDQWMSALGAKPDYASHQFSYAGHVQVGGATSGEVLARVPHLELSNGLEARTSGQILHWMDQDGWDGSLVMDHSQFVNDGLFLLYSGKACALGSGYVGAIDHLHKRLGELLTLFDVGLENQ